jgi:hypothetical protein
MKRSTRKIISAAVAVMLLFALAIPAMGAAAPITIVSAVADIEQARQSFGGGEKSNIAANAITDDLTTRWGGHAAGARADSDGDATVEDGIQSANITLDLGSVHRVSSVIVVTDNYEGLRTWTLEIFTSVDGNTWTKQTLAGDGAMGRFESYPNMAPIDVFKLNAPTAHPGGRVMAVNTTGGSAEEQRSAPQTVTFAATDARYVRIRSYGWDNATGGRGPWFSLANVQVLGTAAAAPTTAAGGGTTAAGGGGGGGTVAPPTGESNVVIVLALLGLASAVSFVVMKKVRAN